MGHILEPSLLDKVLKDAKALSETNRAEAPETVDIALINRTELPPSGAGESSIRPVAAALANAVFDATGARLRRAPLMLQRRKPAPA